MARVHPDFLAFFLANGTNRVHVLEYVEEVPQEGCVCVCVCEQKAEGKALAGRKPSNVSRGRCYRSLRKSGVEFHELREEFQKRGSGHGIKGNKEIKQGLGSAPELSPWIICAVCTGF